MQVTYREVFGVDPGEEVDASRSIVYRPCPAVQALKSQLSAFAPFLGQAHLGGGASRYDEFNRHHAGLAVDIMLRPDDDNMVLLGQNLVQVFIDNRQTMRWLGIIYQHTTVNSNGQAASALRTGNWGPDDHMNHVHIDWFNGGVDWVQCTDVPLRLAGGKVQHIRPKEGSRIANMIPWPAPANTNFGGDATLRAALEDVTNRFAAGTLASIDMAAAATGATTPGTN